MGSEAFSGAQRSYFFFAYFGVLWEESLVTVHTTVHTLLGDRWLSSLKHRGSERVARKLALENPGTLGSRRSPARFDLDKHLAGKVWSCIPTV